MVEAIISFEILKEKIKMYVANTYRRVLAFFVDQFLNMFFYLPVSLKFIFSLIKTQDSVQISWSWLVFLLGFQIVFHVLFLYVLRASPGQWLLGLRTVSMYHPEMGLSLPQCLIHSLLDRFKFFVGNAFYYTAFLNRERRHIINLLAETRVVQSAPSDGLLETRKWLALALYVIAITAGISEKIQLASLSRFDRHGWTIHSN